jgi:prepilin-type processing-associated H-X9-DG protein
MESRGQSTPPDSPVTKETSKLLKTLKIHRRGLSFYALRHTFETIGGESRDQIAVDFIMGHARDDMASLYRERISNERLLAVVAHVHKWLFGVRFRREAEFLFLGLFQPSLSADDAATLCASANSSNLPHGSKGGDTWLLGGFANGLYNHVFPPNAVFPDCSYFGAAHMDEDQIGVFAARSLHGHGVNCVMMDGSVRFVTAKVDIRLWRAIGSRAGAETISNTDF